MTTGMDRLTGKPISGVDHLRQSIRDILTTRAGTRTILRRYGGGAMELVDAPFSQQTAVDLISAITSSLNDWEPRVLVNKVKIRSVNSGAVAVDIEVLYRPEGRAILVDNVVIS